LVASIGVCQKRPPGAALGAYSTMRGKMTLTCVSPRLAMVGRPSLRQENVAAWSSALLGLGALCATIFLPTSAVADFGPPAFVVVIAAIVSSVAGFAFSALAAAFLFHITRDGLEALHILLIASVAMQSYCVWRLRRYISVRRVLPYLTGGLATIPLGLYLLQNLPLRVHTLSLGVFLMFYGAYMLVRRPCRLKTNSLVGQIISGALGGITGSAAAFPGAFITVWCGCHGWDKDQQRAICQPYILAMQIAVLAALSVTSPLDPIRPGLLLYTLPGLAGAWIGVRIYETLNTTQFNKVVCSMLLVSGALLAFKAA
jgi:uncharacterized membrane protein YfcA